MMFDRNHRHGNHHMKNACPDSLECSHIALWKWTVLLAAIFMFTACAVPSSPSVQDTSGGEPVIVNLRPYVGRLVTIQVTVAGQSFPFLFDTGGGWTTATPQVAEAAGCVPFGRLVGFRMNGEMVSTKKCGQMELLLGDVMLVGALGVFDIMALLPDELPKLGGVFALSSLRDRPFTLDLESRQLIFETRGSLASRTKGLISRPIRIGREAAGYGTTIFVEIAADPEPLWFLLDSGNLDAVIVDPHSLPLLNVSQKNGIAPASDEPFDLDIVVSGQLLPDVLARTRDIIYDGILSEAVMRQFVITIDVANEEIWLVPKPISPEATARRAE
jgi:ABC-type Co2+ transport system permease subunit